MVYTIIPKQPIDIMVWELINGLLDLGSISGQVIQKTQSDASLLNTQHNNVWIKGKWSNPGKGVAPLPTP